MTKELIINGINWLDPRMIGLKCWFTPSLGGDEVLGEFAEVANFTKLVFYSRKTIKEQRTAWGNCRLAQGEKTVYDGNMPFIISGDSRYELNGVRMHDGETYRLLKDDYIEIIK